jgi:hypothetical protein
MARRDGLLERALLDTSLQLGPQQSALQSLLSQLAGEYTRKRRVNASNARGIKASTQEAQPLVARAFDTALGSVSAQRAALGAGAPGDPQAAAFQRRVGEQRASALTDLVQQGVRADTGRVYANEQARGEYLGSKGKVLGDLQELAGRQGALTANTYGKLQDDRAQRSLTRRGQDKTAASARGTRRQSERGSIRSSGIDPDTGKPIPGGRLDPKAKKAAPQLASREAHAAARTSIERSIAAIEDLREHEGSRAAIIRLLINGVPAVKGDDGAVLSPAIAPVSADFARAASNLVFDGTLSRKDVERLHNLGLRIRSLGYPTRKRGDAGPKRSRTQTAQDLLTGASQGAVG